MLNLGIRRLLIIPTQRSASMLLPTSMLSQYFEPCLFLLIMLKVETEMKLLTYKIA